MKSYYISYLFCERFHVNLIVKYDLLYMVIAKLMDTYRAMVAKDKSKNSKAGATFQRLDNLF